MTNCSMHLCLFCTQKADPLQNMQSDSCEVSCLRAISTKNTEKFDIIHPSSSHDFFFNKNKMKKLNKMNAVFLHTLKENFDKKKKKKKLWDVTDERSSFFFFKPTGIFILPVVLRKRRTMIQQTQNRKRARNVQKGCSANSGRWINTFPATWNRAMVRATLFLINNIRSNKIPCRSRKMEIRSMKQHKLQLGSLSYFTFHLSKNLQ